jgi:2-dehydropantoate 2-reductase
MSRALRVAVVGAGGVGGYYGGRLAAGGHDVSFLARGDTLEALRTNGLAIESALGNVELPQVVATDDPGAIGPVDAVLLCVKTYDLDRVGPALVPLVREGTAVLCTQNGVDAMDRIAPYLTTGHALAAVVYGATIRPRPGRVRHLGTLARLRIGGRDAAARHRAAELAGACAASGIDARTVDDIDAALWTKLVLFSVMSAACALSDLPNGRLRDDPDSRAMLARGMRETEFVARAKGVALAPDVVERSMEIVDTMAADSVPSMLGDLRAGRPLELESLNGTVVRLGREFGIETPFHETAYAALKHRMRTEPRT